MVAAFRAEPAPPLPVTVGNLFATMVVENGILSKLVAASEAIIEVTDAVAKDGAHFTFLLPFLCCLRGRPRPLPRQTPALRQHTISKLAIGHGF